MMRSSFKYDSSLGKECVRRGFIKIIKIRWFPHYNIIVLYIFCRTKYKNDRARARQSHQPMPETIETLFGVSGKLVYFTKILSSSDLMKYSSCSHTAAVLCLLLYTALQDVYLINMF